MLHTIIVTAAIVALIAAYSVRHLIRKAPTVSNPSWREASDAHTFPTVAPLSADPFSIPQTTTSEWDYRDPLNRGYGQALNRSEPNIHQAHPDARAPREPLR